MMYDILKDQKKNAGIQTDTDSQYLKCDRGTEILVTAVVRGGTIMVLSLSPEEYFDFR